MFSLIRQKQPSASVNERYERGSIKRHFNLDLNSLYETAANKNNRVAHAMGRVDKGDICLGDTTAVMRAWHAILPGTENKKKLQNTAVKRDWRINDSLIGSIVLN